MKILINEFWSVTFIMTGILVGISVGYLVASDNIPNLALILDVVTTIGAILVPLIIWKLNDLHKQINSRMDEFLRIQKELGAAEGKAAGLIEGKESQRIVDDQAKNGMLFKEENEDKINLVKIVK